MACVGTVDKVVEYEFMSAAVNRTSGQCLGPVLTVDLAPYRLELLEDSLMSVPAYDLLWDGFCPDLGNLQFAHCTAHWFDLCFIAGINAQTNQRRDWRTNAAELLRQICGQAEWDLREIANLMVWQRVLLT